MWRCNKAWFLKKTLSSGKSLYIYKYLFIFNLIVTHVGRIEGGRLFEVGANSTLGAYSNIRWLLHFPQSLFNENVLQKTQEMAFPRL